MSSSSSSSISSSFRLFTTKLPKSSLNPTTLSALPKRPNLSFLTRPITFQRLPTTSSSSSLWPSPPAAAASSLQPMEELPPKLQEIVKLFQSVQVPKAKYEQLLFYGQNLKPLDAQFKTKQNKVEGCVSQVWVRAYLDSDMNVFFEADSDSVLTKGLAALLVSGLSGRPVHEVLRVTPDFSVLLGLQQSLTPSRNNGFLNMLKLMQKKAHELLVEEENGVSSSSTSGSKTEISVENVDLVLNSEVGYEKNSTLGSNVDGGIEGLNARLISKENVKQLELVTSDTSENESNYGDLGSRGKRIKERLEGQLSPIKLEVEDISYQHAGHAGVRGSDGETHFNVKVVSKEFEGKSLVKRHRLIYDLLQEELQSGLHALSIVAKTPSEVS